MAKEFPNSFRDPLYASLDARTEAKLGLPVGLLDSIRTNGERSNHDQTNSLDTFSVYQFIKPTRQSLLKNYGLDVTLSPENASEGAGLLLKEGLKRNQGDPTQAVGEYIGGLKRSKWGDVTRAYMGRVMAGINPKAAQQPTGIQSPQFAPSGESTFDRVMAGMTKPAESSMANVLNAYKSGAMSPEDSKAFESSVNDGHVLLPKGESLTAKTDKSSGTALPPGVLAAYQSGRMSPEDKAQVDQGIANGVFAKPFDAVNAIPGQDGLPVTAKPTIEQPTSLMDKAIGTGEAALTLATGATGGALGLVRGAIGGVAQSVRDNSFGTAQGAQDIGQSAAQGMEALTYAPRTQSGQAQAESVGQVMGQVLPVLPMAGELAMLGRAQAPVVAAVNDAAQAAKFGVRQAPAAIQEAVQAIRPSAPVAPTAATAVMPSVELNAVAKKASGSGFGRERATQVLADQAMPNPKTIEAAKRLGIDEYLQPDHVSTSQAYRELSQAVKSIPGSLAREGEVTMFEQVGKRAEKLIEDIGGTTDASTLNVKLKNEMLTTVEQLSNQADTLYQRVRDAIPANTQAVPENTLAFMGKHIEELGGPQRLLPVEKKLFSALNGEDGPVTYAYLDQQRKMIGQATRKASGPFADSEAGLLKKLYSTLSEDQKAVAQKSGAADVYKAASDSVSLRKGIEDDITSIFGKNLDKSMVGDLSSSIKKVASGDTSNLISLLKAVPEGMRQEVVASGLATAFKAANTRGPINFTTYAKWYEGLIKNKQAYTAVMSNLSGQSRKQLSDLYRVSSGISAASRERITTGRINAVTEQLQGADGLATRIYDTAKRGAVGATVGTAAGAVFGPGVGAALASALTKGAKPAVINAADTLIASPAFIKMAKESSRPNAPKLTPENVTVKAFANSKEFKVFANKASLPGNYVERVQWIMQALAPQSQTNQGKK